MALSADQMRRLPACFDDIPDPCRAQGRRHRLSVVLALAAGASLCGMRGHQAMAEWAASLGQTARRRFGCRRENGRYVVPSQFVIHDCLVRVGPDVLARALLASHPALPGPGEALALDGKTMKGAVDGNGAQTQAVSLHQPRLAPLPPPKKLSSLKRVDSDGQKRTNEIGMAIPRRALPLHGQGQPENAGPGHPRHFLQPGEADYIEPTSIANGRIETRRIWTSTALNDYLDFPHLSQIWLIELESIDKKSGYGSRGWAIGVTSRAPRECTPQQLLAINRGHWSIESLHHIIDWKYDEDRIRIGHGPANVTRLRRFAAGVLESFRKPNQNIHGMMRQLARRPRQVLDSLRLTANAAPAAVKSA